MGGNVRYIFGDTDWANAMREAGNKLVVADFSATWCGPCKFIKPTYEQYSLIYQNVCFLYVDEGKNQDLVSSIGIRGFPTFHFYISGKKVDELVGADPNALKLKIETWAQSNLNPFLGTGSVVGSTSSAAIDDPREARLRRFENPEQFHLPRPPSSLEKAPSEDEELKRAIELSRQEVDSTSGSSEIPCNDVLLQQLLEMGFSETSCRQALVATSGTDIESAIAWIDQHQDDHSVDKSGEQAAVNSIKTQLSEAEKAAKIEELKAKIAERRLEKEEAEKNQSHMSEIQRREMGKQMGEAKKEYEAIQRRHEYEKRKREKEDSKRERERLRAEILKDRAERLARGGKIFESSPVTIDPASSKKTESKREASREELIDECINKLKQYRVGNDGLTALRTLKIYTKNLLEKSDDLKYLQINLQNDAFKKRVAGLAGGIGLLKAIGFERNEEGTFLQLNPEDKNTELIQFCAKKVDEAILSLS